MTYHVIRSRGTTHGMKKWYLTIPRCTTCHTKKCVRYPQRDIKTCAGCFKKITGLNLRETIRKADGDYKEKVRFLQVLLQV